MSGPAELARIANQSPAPDFAALFPVVLSASQARDALASEVLMRAGAELAQLARIVMDRLWPLRAVDRVRVRMAGGVFSSSTLVRRAFLNALLAVRRDAAASFAIVHPVAGALALARRGAESARP